MIKKNIVVQNKFNNVSLILTKLIIFSFAYIFMSCHTLMAQSSLATPSSAQKKGVNLLKKPFRVDLSDNSASKDKKSSSELKQEETLMSVILQTVLNNIYQSEIDYNFDVEYVDREGKVKETYLDISMLDISADIKFKNKMIIPLIRQNPDPSLVESMTTGQIKKVVPRLEFTSESMHVVGKFSIQEKGKLSIRFCQNYTASNDFCNTFDDTKLLGVTVKNDTFATLLDVRFKSINLDFENKDAKGNYVFKGSCDSYKNVYDKNTAKSSFKPVECVYSGFYNMDPKIGFKVNFKYRNK